MREVSFFVLFFIFPPKNVFLNGFDFYFSLFSRFGATWPHGALLDKISDRRRLRQPTADTFHRLRFYFQALLPLYSFTTELLLLILLAFRKT